MDNGRCTLGSSFAGVVTVVGARQPEAFNEEGVVGEYFWVDKALTSVSDRIGIWILPSIRG